MSEPAADTFPIDPAWLERMLTTKPDFARRLFEVFLADEPARVQAMAQAIADGDLDLLRHLAHSLKGAAATLGMARVSAACRELEFAARDGLTGGLSQTHARVASEMEAVYARLREVMPRG